MYDHWYYDVSKVGQAEDQRLPETARNIAVAVLSKNLILLRVNACATCSA